MTLSDTAPLDGNAAAGALSEIFAVDVTSAVGQCDWCGATAAIAETRVYALEPGVVVRCAGCDNALIRLVRGPAGAWLDLRGLTFLRIAMEKTS